MANGRYTKLIYDFSSSLVIINKSLTLTGGWNSSFSLQDGYSIIDGEKIYAGVTNVAPDTTLSNFIITNSYGVGNDLGGFLTLDQVAVINNVAQGVSNSFANMTIKNTTISNNGGIGLVNGGGNISVFNSTITNNVSTYSSTYGGGIRNTFGTVTITNSIVANNSAPQSPDCYNMEYGGGALISNGYNIIGSISGCAITATTGDQFNVNPKLSPLLPSGYQALEPLSSAINAGNHLTCLQNDQRGVDRLADAKCDIGAYEYTVPGAATKLFAVNSEIMHTPLNSPFLHPLQVVALDANGSPVGGVYINFSVPNTGPSGMFNGTNSNSANAITTFSGLATSPTLIAGSQIGNYVVNATAPNISSVAAFNLHNGAWFVSPTGVNTNNCLDVTAPCASVFGVLEKPEFVAGETIWLSSGVYPWPNSTSIAINKDVNIEGGWSSTFNLIEGVSEINGGCFLVSYPNLASVKVTRIDFKNVSCIHNNGNLVIENSSIRNIDQIWNTDYGNLTLSNVTVSGKSSMPSAIRNQGILTLLNATITGNQGFTVGGIENESPGTVYLKNSIIAGNTAQNPVDYASADCVGAFISLGNNIIGTIGSQSIYGNYDCYGNWSATDMLGSDISPIPLSKILVPAIQLDASSGQWSHPLMLNSIAINSGDSCPATDQRGVSRPQGGACDIGAYEYVFDRSPSSALIRTYDVGNATILPGTKVCDETNWACPGGDVEAKNAHRFAKDLYDFYLAEHNRLSLDDQGIEILSAVNYGNNYQNAYWNGYMAVFGDGFTNSDDVAIHELTHGVTQYESNLFYFYQSGAINESFSDLWGEYYDQLNGLGTDTPAVRWLIGEDIIGATPIRNMSNPPAYGDPDKMTSPNYDISAADNGGVHTNSGVNNKAVSLMVDGGTFNGRTVTALGWD